MLFNQKKIFTVIVGAFLFSMSQAKAEETAVCKDIGGGVLKCEDAYGGKTFKMPIPLPKPVIKPIPDQKKPLGTVNDAISDPAEGGGGPSCPACGEDRRRRAGE